METLIQNIPVAAALVLPVVLVLMVVTNIIVEVLKKLTWGKLPTNLLAFAVTLLAFFAACQIMGVAVTWYMVVAAVVMGVFVAYAAMFGFDKLRQTLEQLDSIKKNN